jgi:hypothetical protein
MSNNKGWIGVDLDGTLAEYYGWQGHTHIGKPIPKMIARVRLWLEKGERVKIFTARVCDEKHKDEIVSIIDTWCLEHLGRILEVTNVKDYGMIVLWDDRCVSVVPNTGNCASEYDEK